MNNPDMSAAAAVNILVVEDSKTQADHLAYLLSSDGYRVELAENGCEGLALARMIKPSLIVSDIAMPEMDGFTMCRHLKDDADLREIPVILLTSLNSLHDMIKGLDCGADNFIRKPFDGKYLLGRIRIILANRALVRNERVQIGMQVNLGGQTHFITAERQQMFDLLLSTYEEAIQMAEELKVQQTQIVHSYQSMKGLYNLAEALNTSMSPKRVAETALDRLLDFPGVIGGCLKLTDANGNFHVAAVQDYDHVKTEQYSERTNADCAVLERLPHQTLFEGSPINVPLATGERILGVLDLLKNPTASADDLQVLNTAGSQIATALERAHLYTKMETLVQERTEALQSERNLLSAVLNTTGALVLLVDKDGCIVMFNPACEKTLGWKFEEVIGRCYWDVFLTPASAKTEKAFFQNIQLMKTSPEIQSKWIARDGTTRHIIWSTTYLKKSDQLTDYFLGTGIDVTELRGAEQKIKYLSNFDIRTGLPNQILLRKQLGQLRDKFATGRNVIGLLLVRFERLPLIRESLGTAAEQALLLQIASRLSQWHHADENVACIGENSFAVVTVKTGPDEMSAVARQILELMDRPFHFEHHELHIEASIGIAIMPNDGNDYDALIQGAEVAIRRALGNDRERYAFHKPEHNHSASERFKLESALRRALGREEFFLQYQPQVDLTTGKIVGAEALLRWEHPEFGLVAPNRFIAIAEETGLIVPIGGWVIRTACAQAKAWQNAGLGEMRIAVNLSARQFNQPDLVSSITDALEQTGLAANCLEVEVTESLVMTDVGRAVEVLNQLRTLGVKLAIDDFGTGYSSLAYLKQFPIDMLKIDQSFVREISPYSNDAAISDAIISMAHSLGIRVIAEGVETEAQCEFLAQHMCDEVQGHLFSQPLGPSELEVVLRDARCLPPRLLRMQKRQPTLLLVDDEPNILSALKRQMRSAGYRILTADSGPAGLELLSKNDVDVIVSDQRMPGMTGVEFLRTVKTMYPDTVRIVLSGFTELQSVTDAVNEGAIYKFLTKPWDDVQLRAHIQEAFQHRDMAEENRRLDLEVRTANHGLAQANRQLEELLKQKQKQIKQDEITLDIVREALQHVPSPILGLDEDQVVAFANLAAQDLFRQHCLLLGSEADLFIPDVMRMLRDAEEGQKCITELGGLSFEVISRSMGRGTQSRGTLITFTRVGGA